MPSSIATCAELAVRSDCALGESPRWSVVEQRLYWVDVPRGALHVLDPASGAHHVCHRVGTELGACALDEDGVLLFGAGGAVSRWRREEDTSTPVVGTLRDEATSRYNDVSTDARGRIICGTMPTKERAGRLYALDLDGVLRCVREGVRVPNGIAFTTDGRILYVDSMRKAILSAPYDLERGALGEATVLVQVARGEGVPDGIALDEAGGVWCALWGGGALVRYDTDGTETHRVTVPTRHVSALAFTGAALDTMMITTAQAPGDELAGALFHARPPYRGRAPHLARIRSTP